MRSVPLTLTQLTPHIQVSDVGVEAIEAEDFLERISEPKISEPKIEEISGPKIWDSEAKDSGAKILANNISAKGIIIAAIFEEGVQGVERMAVDGTLGEPSGSHPSMRDVPKGAIIIPGKFSPMGSYTRARGIM